MKSIIQKYKAYLSYSPFIASSKLFDCNNTGLKDILQRKGKFAEKLWIVSITTFMEGRPYK